MILAYDELMELVAAGVITDVDPAAVNGTSIDVHLGDTFLQELPPINETGWHTAGVINLALRESPSLGQVKPDAHGCICLDPGQFVLASTREVFHLPNDLSAQFLLKSSVARAGLSHALATWADPGWHGSALTLELHNLLRWHVLKLQAGMPIGQMIFHRHVPVPADASYAARGRYNNDAQVQAQKM